MDRHLEGTIEADELYYTTGKKGQAKQGGTKWLGVGRVVAARNANPAGAIMTKTDRP